jgi:hypothetical protein
MTRLAVGFGRGFPRIWLLPIGMLTLVLGIAVSGRLSRSIVADFIAWWPVWVGLALAAYFFRNRKVGLFRAAGLVPLIALLFVGLFTWGHLAGWEMMPSASQRLVGPDLGGFNTATMTAKVDGTIEVRGGARFLYVVEPIRRGGGVGIPTAAEQMVDSSVEVELQAPSDPGFYSYAGWDIELSETPVWTLMLDGALQADLTTLDIERLALGGSGLVNLGAADDETGVAVDGVFHLVVPAGVPARVNGRASVPASWTPDAIGAVSPEPGDGWVITVAPGARVTVSEASNSG